YYPNCVPLPRFTAPVLIFAAGRDDWTPADSCRAMIAKPHPDSAPIEMIVYPEAHHGFDVVQLQPGRASFGHWIEYNEAAAKDAEARVKTFLAVHLGPGTH